MVDMHLLNIDIFLVDLHILKDTNLSSAIARAYPAIDETKK